MSPTPASSRITSLLLVLGLALGVACSSGGGGGSDTGGGTGGGTGSVGVIVTDGPVDPDLFEHIYVTITDIVLIGDGGQESIYSGRRVIDLRDFEDVGKLVTLGRRVPARSFSKIRLLIDDIELVPADGSDPIHPKLPPKIDVNPQQKIEVKPGSLLLLQIDFAAGESLHIVQKGNKDEFNFRPVIFADILSVRLPGKLVLVEGVVEELDLDAGRFLLCRTGHAVSRPAAEGRVTRSDDEGFDTGDRDDFCVEVVTDDDTSVFDENGDPAELSVLENGDEASVLGRFRGDQGHDGEALVLVAEVIQQGPPGTAQAIDGEVVSEVDADGRFEILVDPGQGFAQDTVLQVELQQGAKVLSRKGKALEVEDIQVGAPVRVTGVLVLSNTQDDLLKASVVVLDVEGMMFERISGEITSVEDAGASLEIDTEDGARCVDVPADARVFAVTVDGDDASAEPIDRSELQVGDEVNVFGDPDGPGGCLRASTVIAFFVEP